MGASEGSLIVHTSQFVHFSGEGRGGFAPSLVICVKL